MPPADGQLTNLGPELFGMLLRGLTLLILGAVVVGVLAYLLAGRTERLPHVVPTHVLRVFFAQPPGGDHGEPRARRFLRLCLAALWIIDGLLQAQPKMPAGFVPDVVGPDLAASPSWLASAVHPVIGIWTKHPVVADAATVWVQVGLGLLLLLGGRCRFAHLSLWLAIAWSLFVWVFGELLGGLFADGAGWLVGSPGAVLVYAIAAALLLVPDAWWESGRAALLARRSVAGWLLFGALLQALPAEGFWSGSGLSMAFADGAGMSQPEIFRRPIAFLATLTGAHPVVANAVLVGLLVLMAVALWISAAVWVATVCIAVLAATWWLAQDFGVLGGTGTDPNTALPLGVLLCASLPSWRAMAGRRNVRVTARRAGRLSQQRTRASVAAAAVALAVGSAVIAPLLLTGVLVRPADADAVAVDSGGGLHAISPRPAPGFTLVDQTGHQVTLAALHGKAVVLTFLDPVCSDDCPVIANELAIADRELGVLAPRVEFVAIDTNPLFHNVADVAAFTRSHEMSDLANWHFAAGAVDTLQAVLASYGISVDVPTVGMIQHSDGVYFIAANGTEAAYLGDGASAGLTSNYVNLVNTEIRRLLA